MTGRDDDATLPPSDPGAPDPPREDAALTEALGRAIKVIRAGHDLGRRELADRAGLSYSYLAEIENGKKLASSSAQQAIAAALGITVSELLAAAEEWAVRIANELPLNASLSDELPVSVAREPLGSSSIGARARQLRWMRGSRNNQPTFAFEDEHDDPAFVRRHPQALVRSSMSLGTDERSARHLHAVTIELLEILGALTEEDRERVLDLARRLAGR